MTRRFATRETLNSICYSYSLCAVEFSEYLLAQYTKANIVPSIWSHLREAIAESTAGMIDIQSKIIKPTTHNMIAYIWNDQDII